MFTYFIFLSLFIFYLIRNSCGSLSYCFFSAIFLLVVVYLFFFFYHLFHMFLFPLMVIFLSFKRSNYRECVGFEQGLLRS